MGFGSPRTRTPALGPRGQEAQRQRLWCCGRLCVSLQPPFPALWPPPADHGGGLAHGGQRAGGAVAAAAAAGVPRSGRAHHVAPRRVGGLPPRSRRPCPGRGLRAGQGPLRLPTTGPGGQAAPCSSLPGAGGPQLSSPVPRPPWSSRAPGRPPSQPSQRDGRTILRGAPSACLAGTRLGGGWPAEAGRRVRARAGGPFLSACRSRSRLGQLCWVPLGTGRPASPPWETAFLALPPPMWPRRTLSRPRERPAWHPAPPREHWPRGCPVPRPAVEETQGLG